MEIEYLVKKDFPYMSQNDPKHDNGCACFEIGKAWVFLDNVLGEGNLYEVDIVEQCWHCKNETKHGDCSNNIEPFLNTYVQEINRVTIHELLHLCDLSESEIGNIDHKLYPFWQCPFFVEKGEG